LELANNCTNASKAVSELLRGNGVYDSAVYLVDAPVEDGTRLVRNMSVPFFATGDSMADFDGKQWALTAPAGFQVNGNN
jgi:hypothetical protein